MSFLNYYEYIPGEYQDVSRDPLSAAGPDPAWFLDTNGVKLAGYNVELWDSVSGGVQLLEGTDYSLVYQDAEKSLSEGQPIWAGYQIITPIYQDVSLYLTIRMIGGYTVYHGDTVTGVIVEDSEINGQRVVKWDTGLMIIYLVYFESIAVSILVTNEFGSTSGDIFYADFLTIYAVPFVSNPAISHVTNGVSPKNLTSTESQIETRVYYRNPGTNISFRWTAIGRWK